jgi:hypothetical protein
MPGKTKKPARRPAAKRLRKPARPAGSVISAEYRKQHQPDELAQRLRSYVNGDDGRIDPAKLRAVAEANDAWRDRYAALNPGMQFMNVSVRLRALVRNGGKVAWGQP